MTRDEKMAILALGEELSPVFKSIEFCPAGCKDEMTGRCIFSDCKMCHGTALLERIKVLAEAFKKVRKDIESVARG